MHLAVTVGAVWIPLAAELKESHVGVAGKGCDKGYSVVEHHEIEKTSLCR